jgi:hypothetical protein
MDQSVASLYPIHQIGSDGFSWWIGQVETDKKDDPKRSGRYRVRIIGQHLKTGENATPTDELPWAHIMMPVTTPFIEGGTGGASPGLKRGCFVVGFYLDNDKQKPIIMGSIGGVKGATKESNDDENGSGPLNFKAVKDPKINPQQNRSTETQKGKNKEGANTDKGVVDADQADKKGGAPPILLAAYAKHSETNPTGGKSCVVIANPNCGQENNLKSGLTRIMGDLLAANQASGGQIGDFYVSKINGLLYDGVGQARYHIGRVVRLVKSFIARGKTEIVKQLRGAIDFLNKTILTTEATVGYVAQGPYKDPDEAFVPIKERSNKLKKVKEIFDKIFESLGCSIADLTDLIAKFITDLIMGFLTDVFNNAACFIDTLVDGILNEILAQFDALVAKILAPIQAILDAIAAPLNFIGGIIAKFMALLGITCTGPAQKCEPIQEKCTDCGSKDSQDDLDKLLAAIEDGIGDTSLFVCDESKIVAPKQETSVTFVGGVYDDPTSSPENVTPDNDDDDSTIDYGIPDVDPPDDEDDPEDDGTIEGDATPEFPVDEDGDPVTLPDDDVVPYVDVYTNETLYGEGEVIVYNIKGVNIPNGTEFEYVLSGPNITSTDIEEGLTGTFIVNGNTSTVQVTISQDNVVELAPELLTFTATAIVDVTDDEGTVTSYPLEATTDVVIDSEVATPDEVISDANLIATWNVRTDKRFYQEGEDVLVTVTTQNVPDDTEFTYYMVGANVTADDFVSRSLGATMRINNNVAAFIIGIEDDTEIEGTENVTLIISGKGVSTNFSIGETAEGGENELEEDTQQDDFIPKKPVAGTPLTDEDGSIISIPIDTPGGPYQTAPQVIITGNGYGAGAVALLDGKGFVSEVRVTRQGVNYVPNTANNNGLLCVVDSYTMLSPGSGYETAPTVLVNGVRNLAEAIIDERGFVVSIRNTDRSKRYTSMPEIKIFGGGGAGARFLPNMVCLDSNDLERRGYAKIGTGSYVDCP